MFWERRLTFQTKHKEALIDLTEQIKRLVEESGVLQGFCQVFVPHTTAGITINETADPDVAADLLFTLQRLVPHDLHFRHREGNADAHVKSTLIGASVVIPISKGSIVLGTWQGILFGEFDGPRNRQIIVQVMGE